MSAIVAQKPLGRDLLRGGGGIWESQMQEQTHGSSGAHVVSTSHVHTTLPGRPLSYRAASREALMRAATAFVRTSGLEQSAFGRRNVDLSCL